MHRHFRHALKLIVVLPCVVLALQGCAFFAGAAVGAVGGYVAKEQGYKLRSPVTHDDRQDSAAGADEAPR